MPKKHKAKQDYRVIYFGIILFAMALLVIAIQFFDIKLPEPDAPLLPEAPGRITLAEPSTLHEFTQIPLTTPTETFGSEVYVFGIYTESVENLPAGTIAQVFVKDRERTFEIFQKPGIGIEVERKRLQKYDEEEIVLNGKTAYLYTINQVFKRCITAKEDGAPGICHLSQALVFALDDETVTIGVDSDKLTTGELLMIAKSMLNEKTAE